MTYNVFGGTFSLTQSINQSIIVAEFILFVKFVTHRGIARIIAVALHSQG